MSLRRKLTGVNPRRASLAVRWMTKRMVKNKVAEHIN
jgi:hypothetical protein